MESHHKKAAGKQAHGKPKKGAGKDLRRAYEHLARASVLEAASGADGNLRTVAIRLRELALEHLDAANPSDAKVAAEFARAAEHAGFAALVGHVKSAISSSDELDAALRHEYEKLADEARVPSPKKSHNQKDSITRADELVAISHTLIGEAEASLAQEQFARAMECIRSAEALASVRDHLKHH